MSYCRWSSDCYNCDAYVYGAEGDIWITHLANRRYVNPEPRPAPFPAPNATPEELLAWYNAGREWVDHATLVRIELPHAGESFSDDSPGACADRLESLRALGYIIPQYAIDELRAEQAMPTGIAMTDSMDGPGCKILRSKPINGKETTNV